MPKQENPLDKPFLELNKRIGVIISILIRLLPKEGRSICLKEQVSLLSSLEMRPKDIAGILGRTQSHINKELAGLKKGKKKNAK